MMLEGSCDNTLHQKLILITLLCLSKIDANFYLLVLSKLQISIHCGYFDLRLSRKEGDMRKSLNTIDFGFQ